MFQSFNLNIIFKGELLGTVKDLVEIRNIIIFHFGCMLNKGIKSIIANS